MSISLRIKELITEKKMNISSFEKKIEVGNNSIGTIITKNTNVSGNILSKILNSFPDISADWLVTGKGNMFRELKEYPTNDNFMKLEEPGQVNEVVIAQKKTITILEREVEDLRSDKSFLKNVIENKLGKDKSA